MTVFGRLQIVDVKAGGERGNGVTRLHNSLIGAKL